MELVKDIAAVVGLLSGIFAFIVSVSKQAREWFGNALNKSIQYNTIMRDIEDIKSNMDIVLKYGERINSLETALNKKEKSDILEMLSMYHRRAVDKEPISHIDYERVKSLYNRYANELHCNHEGTMMFDAITEYYSQHGGK